MGRSTKIQGDSERFVCNLLSQEKSVSEICRMLKSIHNIDVGAQVIYRIKKSKELEIEQIRRAKYNLDIKLNIPIASESVRLEREESLYQLSQTLELPINKIDYGLRCLKEAREETKIAVQPAQTNIQFNQFNQLTDEELIAKKQSLEKKLLGLTALTGRKVCQEAAA